MRNCFEILGIEPTDEIKKIKRAYAAKSKECHPEEHPVEFEELHDAYERALAWARQPKEVRDAAEVETMDTGAAETMEAETADEWGEAFEKLHSAAGAGAAEAETVTSAADSGADEWTEAFEQLHSASETKASQSSEVSRILELCTRLYCNEKERNKLYHWKDILEEEEFAEVMRSRSFVPAWYEFLEQHTMFDVPVWKYFASLDGVRFSGESSGIPRMEYSGYIEEALKREEQRKLEEQQAAGAGNAGKHSGGAVGRERLFRRLWRGCLAWTQSEKPMIGRIACYFLNLIVSAFVCAVAGMVFGLLFG